MTLELFQGQRGVLARFPVFHVEEAGLGAHPQVQVLRFERVGEPGRANRPGLLTFQVLLEH
ncbi:hypothetical protein D3C71_1745100 [compost metagenome]